MRKIREEETVESPCKTLAKKFPSQFRTRNCHTSSVVATIFSDFGYLFSFFYSTSPTRQRYFQDGHQYKHKNPLCRAKSIPEQARLHRINPRDPQRYFLKSRHAHDSSDRFPPAHQHYHSTRAKAPREPRRVKLCRLEPLKGENFCRDLPKKKPARSAPPLLLSLSTHHSNALPIAPFHAHKHTHTHVRGKLAEEPFSKNASKPCHDQTETEISPVNVRGVQQVAAQCSGEQRSKRSRQVRRERAREVDRSLFSSWFVLGPAS